MPTENGTENIQDRLHRLLLEHSKEVDGEREVNLLSFAYASPFDLPEPADLVDEYEECSLSDLRALHEHSQESRRNYWRRIQAAGRDNLDAPAEKIRDWWEHLCRVVVRAQAVDSLLTAATVFGPDGYTSEVRDGEVVLESSKMRQTSTNKNTVQEIAAKVLKVLDREPAKWPDKTTDLLKRVDDLRGVKERTTYRYLHDKLGDEKPADMWAWQDWAEEQL